MKDCIVCGKSFTNPGRQCNGCRNKAWKQRNRERYLQLSSDYNKRHWQKIKPAHSEKKCENCSKVFMPHSHTPKYQRYCSDKCRLKVYRETHKEDIRLWRRESYKRNRETILVKASINKDKTRFNGNRIKALEGDGNKCVDCGSPYGNLNVHHIDHSGQTDNPNHELDNLVTLCAACHLRRHEHWLNTIRAKK